MRVIAIIAEYNPFHNGHEYQIKKAKEEFNADYVIVLMTGNYNQRGMPAILSKNERAQMAIEAGVDLVLELPSCFAIEDVPEFSYISTQIVDGLSVVDYLLFSSESGQFEMLDNLSDIVCSNAFESLMRANADCLSPSKRRVLVLRQLGKEQYIEEINKPNNLFGAYFISGLKRLNSKTQPVTIRRVGNNYLDTEIVDSQRGKNYSSATAIRNLIFDSHNSSYFPKILEKHVPIFVYRQLEKLWQESYPIEKSDFWYAIKNAIETLSVSLLLEISGFTEEVAKRVKEEVLHAESYQDCARRLHEFEPNINYDRLLFRVIVGEQNNLTNRCLENGALKAIQCIAKSSRSRPLLELIKQRSSIVVFEDQYELTDALSLSINQRSLLADTLYYSTVSLKYKNEKES